MSWFRFRPYVSVAKRRHNAQREVTRLAKKGQVIRPVQLDGRTIARTFWGKAWCDNLESYMDYANRLPRGRSYIRNGSVVHLDIQPGAIRAMVSGSSLYRVNITIQPATRARWQELCRECSGGIGSLVELLQGRFSDRVMNILTRKEIGLFPAPKEITLKCSCPDWAVLCKHVAAVLYGVGARLDEQPELLFRLRSVDADELISQAASVTDLTAKVGTGEPELAEGDLGEVFGIDLDSSPAPTPVAQSASILPVGPQPTAAPGPKPKVRAKTKAKAKAKAKVPTRSSTAKPPRAKSRARKMSETARQAIAAAAKRRLATLRSRAADAE